MSIIAIPFVFSAGAVIIASQHNACNSIIYSDYNGNVDNTNIAPAAAIAYTKLNLTGMVIDADISSGAAIADSKLDQITTASKVSGTAITGLASLPSGAGIVPAANLGTGTANSTTFLRGDGAYAAPAISSSNVLFQYHGQIEAQGAGIGEVVGTTFTPGTSITGNYRFLQTHDPSSSGAYIQIWSSKFIKILGISTVTVWSRIWTRISSQTASIKVTISTISNNVSGTNDQTTPEWQSFTMDVSSLTNGTTYDVIAYMREVQTASAGIVYCSDIIGFGS